MFLSSVHALCIWFLSSSTAMEIHEAVFNFIFMSGWNAMNIATIESYPTHLRYDHSNTVLRNWRIQTRHDLTAGNRWFFWVFFFQNDRIWVRECYMSARRHARSYYVQQLGDREPCGPHVDSRCCSARGRNCIRKAARDELGTALGITSKTAGWNRTMVMRNASHAQIQLRESCLVSDMRCNARTCDQLLKNSIIAYEMLNFFSISDVSSRQMTSHVTRELVLLFVAWDWKFLKV